MEVVLLDMLKSQVKDLFGTAYAVNPQAQKVVKESPQGKEFYREEFQDGGGGSGTKTSGTRTAKGRGRAGLSGGAGGVKN